MRYVICVIILAVGIAYVLNSRSREHVQMMREIQEANAELEETSKSAARRSDC